MRNNKLNYIDHFISLKCSSFLLERKIFPNSKEITESFGMYKAVGNHLRMMSIEYGDPNINLYIVGDGGSPRTGAIFACLTKWNITSIDPEMKDKPWGIDRLTCIKDFVQFCKLGDPQKISLILFPHSHCKIPLALKTIVGAKRHIFAMPCCVHLTVPNREPDADYQDQYILSLHNRIKIWFDV